jgi:fatty-acyl-CoA synthase
MNGYWRRGEKTQPILTSNKWFVSNDLGYWDNEGRLYFCGRMNDAIRTGGETVLASEVERVLLSHPGVDECAVFALPDARFGQAVSCAIVSSSSEKGSLRLSLPYVREWCQQQGLASFKRPRHLFIVQQLPKNSSGKTLKFLLIDRFSRNDKQLQSKL